MDNLLAIRRIRYTPPRYLAHLPGITADNDHLNSEDRSFEIMNLLDHCETVLSDIPPKLVILNEVRTNSKLEEQQIWPIANYVSQLEAEYKQAHALVPFLNAMYYESSQLSGQNDSDTGGVITEMTCMADLERSRWLVEEVLREYLTAGSTSQDELLKVLTHSPRGMPDIATILLDDVSVKCAHLQGRFKSLGEGEMLRYCKFREARGKAEFALEHERISHEEWTRDIEDWIVDTDVVTFEMVRDALVTEQLDREVEGHSSWLVDFVLTASPK